MATYVCPVCGYAYDEATGDPREGYPAGTPWISIPDDFVCPDCSVRGKEEFIAADFHDER